MNQPNSNPESRMWAMLAHLSALSGFILPFGNIVGPLIVWLIKRDEMSFVNDQAKEALNFNLSLTIYMVVPLILIFLLIGFQLVLPLVIVVSLAWLVLTILAATKAKEGVLYRYPLVLRLVK